MENENVIEVDLKTSVSNRSNNDSTGDSSNSAINGEDNFIEVTEDTVQLWKAILFKDRSDKIKFAKEDTEILNEALDLQNQKVIKNDCDRTRVKDKHLVPGFRESLEAMLTFYCRQNCISYKQGMNEVMGPLILLMSKTSMSLTNVYNIFCCFMEKYLTNYYHEEEFFSLQSSLGLLSLLLKYHDPVVYNVFEYALITPEMYATSWVLTIFANKTKLNTLYHLWDVIIKEDDELFIHFFIIGFLMLNKNLIITTDHSQIPSVLSLLCLKSNFEVDTVAETAREVRQSTPFSIRLIVRKLEIFKPHSTRLKELFEVYQPESMLCLPILPSEVFSIAYNNIVSCPDYLCKYFMVRDDCEDNIPNEEEKLNDFTCHHCSKKQIDNLITDKNSQTYMNYILLDLRVSEKKAKDKHLDVKPGFLPMTVILEQEELNDEKFAENLTDKFLNEKDKYHFILITSETDYFSEYEEKFYKECISDKDKKKMLYGLHTKVTKEINEKLVKQTLKKDKTKIMKTKIKEFDILKRLIKNFLSKNYPYVSYVYGGFKDIHEQSMKYNIPLLNHDEKCILCMKEKKKSSKKSGFLSKLFKKKKEDQVGEVNSIKIESDTNLTIDHISSMISDPNYIAYTCLLVEYKKLYDKLDKHLQIMLFLDNKELKVFKLDREKTPNKQAKKEKICNDSLSFILIEIIKVSDILSIISKKQTKSIVTIQFSSQTSEQKSIVIDLITDNDSKSFITKTKTAVENSDKNNK